MSARPTITRTWWLSPAVTAAAIAVFAAAFFLVPQVNTLVRTAGSALSTEEVSSVRLFTGTWGRGSVFTIVVLGVWQAVAAPLPHEALVRAAADTFGPVLGFIASWLGLVLGALAAFGIARALIGRPLRLARERQGELPQPIGIAHWVLLGLCLIPFVPQDFVSYIFGATRLSWRDFAWVTALSTLPTVTYFTAFVEDPEPGMLVYRLASSAVGVAVLGWLAWRERTRIPVGALTAERKRQLAIAAVLTAAGTAAYLLVPGVREWVTTAIDVLTRGDIEFVRDYLLGFGVWAPVVSSLLMVLQSIAAPLPAFVVTFANGLLFGWVWGAALSWSSAMAGAALCFWIARSFGRPAVEKLAGGSNALGVSDLFFEKYGRKAVLIARLLPFVSFDIISYGAGLTSMSFWSFFWATGVGQLPATLVYSYLGQNLTGSVRVLVAIFLITIAIFVAASAIRPIYMARLAAKQPAAEPSEEPVA